jgi:hypothetical protein
MREGEVIAKLAEDAYFMQVDNKVTQVPPVQNRQQDNEDTSRSADISRNRTRGELPANPNRTRATAGGPSHGGNSTDDDREIFHINTGIVEDLQELHSRMLGTTREDFGITQISAGVPSSLGMLQAFLRAFDL